MQVEAADIQDDIQHLEMIEEELQALEQRLNANPEPRVKQWLRNTLARERQHLRDLPAIRFTFPEVVFAKQLVFHGSRRNVQLIDAGARHTASDAYLLLPDERLAFIGDLGFFQRQPFMIDCHPEAWKQLLLEMQGWEVDVFVPGHGAVGTKRDLTLQLEYLEMIEVLVKTAVAKGEALEEVRQRQLPPPFASWSADGLPKEANLRILFDHFQKAHRMNSVSM